MNHKGLNTYFLWQDFICVDKLNKIVDWTLKITLQYFPICQPVNCVIYIWVVAIMSVSSWQSKCTNSAYWKFHLNLKEKISHEKCCQQTNGVDVNNSKVQWAAPEHVVSHTAPSTVTLSCCVFYKVVLKCIQTLINCIFIDYFLNLNLI